MSTIRPDLVLGIASDHGGFTLKQHLVELLQQWGLQVEDLGTHGPEPVDYPDFAKEVAHGVAGGRFRLGVLVCGSGIGMSIAANRFPGVRAAVCTSAYMAKVARAHNDANILCLGERVSGGGEAEDILRAFLDGVFEGGRHARRVAKLESLPPAGGE